MPEKSSSASGIFSFSSIFIISCGFENEIGLNCHSNLSPSTRRRATHIHRDEARPAGVHRKACLPDPHDLRHKITAPPPLVRQPSTESSRVEFTFTKLRTSPLEGSQKKTSYRTPHGRAVLLPTIRGILHHPHASTSGHIPQRRTK